jgi:2-succinyl-5-enolpyruvyl-6-hydroxy-3-cyclohexene-1-carboxylate synthase
VSGRDATTAFATALVDEWARSGCTDAIVAPGSRSTPLALALARDERIRVQTVLDERSAAFRALGLALATGRPAIVLCTSGTAVANFHPAVVEASHARVPLVVCTADRPPELRDSGAGQTIDQTKLFGESVRWFTDPGPPADLAGAGGTWRALACRSVAEALGPPAGPVHLNLPLREPLVPTGEPLVPAPGRAGGQPWTVTMPSTRTPGPATVEELAQLVRATARGVIVAGWGAEVEPATMTRLARAARWPLLADPISQLRVGPHTVSTYEALLREPAFATAHLPDVALRVGAPLTSKAASQWLLGVSEQLVVDPDDVWLDPTHAASRRLACPPEVLCDALATALEAAPVTRYGRWFDEWQDAERAARIAIDALLDAAAEPFEGLVAREVAAALPEGATLVAASSLPVRALEWCMAPRDGLRIVANRGANGIDGFVSTAAGLAAGAAGPVVALCGDLCFLHDVNGLLGIGDLRTPPTYVVVDNDGGGIFSFLPQDGLPEFEALFGTPHGLDLVAVARAHGVSAVRVDDVDHLRAALAAGDARVVVIGVDRAKSVERHGELWSAVAAALVPGSASGS